MHVEGKQAKDDGLEVAQSTDFGRKQENAESIIRGNLVERVLNPCRKLECCTISSLPVPRKCL